MVRQPFLIAACVAMLAGCFPPSTSPAFVAVYWVPVAPVYYAPVYYPPPLLAGEFQSPSLAIRALAGRISESASNGDCEAAIRAGDELERLERPAHHAVLAVDERYARCVRGF